jgi:hypothetical protein
MSNQIISNPPRAFDRNGYTVPGAKMFVYQAGTSTLLDVFSDTAGTVPAENPVIADADGLFPQRYVNQAAKAVITTADDVILYTLDPAPVVQATGAGASQISFAPSVEVPANNVQSAIDLVAASVISGFTGFGLGITGNAGLLTDLNATTIEAGAYRFDGTTTGTYPSGVAAADTGLVETWRQASNTAMMMLYHATTDRVFHRRLAGGVWGAWREVVTVNQTLVRGDTIRRGASSLERVALGTSGHVWTSNGTDAVWAAPTSGRVLLATKTASASATLSFTEFNNAIYRRYEFDLEFIKPATDNVALSLRFSTNGGSTYDSGASDYTWGVNGTTASSTTSDASIASSQIILTHASLGVGNAAAEYGVTGRVEIVGAPQTAVSTEALWQLNYWRETGTQSRINGGGTRAAAQDTAAVRFVFTSGNIASGTIRMFGIV